MDLTKLIKSEQVLSYAPAYVESFGEVEGILRLWVEDHLAFNMEEFRKWVLPYCTELTGTFYRAGDIVQDKNKVVLSFTTSEQYARRLSYHYEGEYYQVQSLYGLDLTTFDWYQYPKFSRGDEKEVIAIR